MMETIHADWDEMVIDSWMEGNFKPEFNVYDLWKKHGLKGNVINAFRAKVQFEYDLVSDAYNKTCEQAVEAYSHISPKTTEEDAEPNGCNLLPILRSLKDQFQSC